MNNTSLEQNIKNVYDRITRAINDQNSGIIQENISLIESIEQEFELSFDLKKKYGAFYTKKEISSFILIRTLILYLNKHIDKFEIGDINEIFALNQDFKRKVSALLLSIKICDPACGLGAFILSALEILFSLILKLNKEDQLEQHEIIQTLFENLYGFDINQSALNLCRLKLYFWAIQNKILDLKKIHKIVSSQISLRNSLFELENQTFDIVIGNPPYGNIMREREKKALKSQGIYYNDIYCAFILKTLQWSEGIIGFLVPKSFLLRQSYLSFRHQLLSKANLLEIYDLGPKLFRKATNEVQIVIFEKKTRDLPPLRVFKYPDEKVISYPGQKYDNLRICLNNACPLCSRAQKVHVYTFALKCPYCGSNTHELHRIRISYNNKIKQVIEKIEKAGDLNLLNIKDFPNMIRGEEANGLTEVKKLLKVETGGSCNFIYAKDDFQYYYYTKNKSFDLDKVDSKTLKGQNFEYYTQPKLLIKHNTILPQAAYSEDKLCFTSSIYSLLDDDIINLKYLCALINSSLIQFYCFYGINNQQNTTINLNQYMIRHLPLKNVDNNDKLMISRKVDLIIEAFRTNKGQIDNNIAKIWLELDEGFFHIYSLSEEDKGIILNSIKGEIDFLKIIYSR